MDKTKQQHQHAPSSESAAFTFSENVLPPYSFDPELSTDDNFMVWAMTYIRCSTSRRGQMACLMVDPLTQKVIIHSNNTPLVTYFTPPKSPLTASSLSKKSLPELHAEARCIALASRAGTSLAGLTAYITFPPCDVCFHLLSACGVKRVVFRNALRSNETRALALAAEVELVELGDGRTEVGRKWDDEIRRRAALEWSKLGETGEVTKARNAQAWLALAQRSVELSVEVLAAEAAKPMVPQKRQQQPGDAEEAETEGAPATKVARVEDASEA